MERSMHDLFTFVALAGEVGRLTTCQIEPVLPGDGFSLDFVGAVKMSPLTRNLVFDARVDICTFFTPMRFIYDNWVTFIEEGVDTSETLGTEQNNGTYPTSCLGTALPAGINNLPLWLTEPYRMVWSHYFRPPTTVAVRNLSNKPLNGWGADECAYGFGVGQLKHIWTATSENTVDSSDYNVASATNVSLLAIDQQRGRLRSEQEREFFNMRYRDIIKDMGGKTHESADERPRLLGKTTFWTSGYDRDATDGANLGDFVGRVEQPFRHSIPRFYVPEHGVINTVAVLRYPPIHTKEQHYLINTSSPSYKEIAGDWDIVVNEPPHQVQPADFFMSSGSTNDLGDIPYAQWYRVSPHNVHEDFETKGGYPTIDAIPTTEEEANRITTSSAFDDMVSDQSLGHFQIIGRANKPTMRYLPSAADTLMSRR